MLELSTEALHLLLTHIVHLWREPPVALLPPESRQAFLSALQRDFPRSRVPVVLAPLLYPDSDILMEKITQEQPANMAKNLVSCAVYYEYRNVFLQVILSVMKM